MPHPRATPALGYPTPPDPWRSPAPYRPPRRASAAVWTPAFGDMVECPGGCGKPIVRRLRDGLAHDLNHTPHRCPGPVTGEEDAYRRALAESTELGVWPWTRRQWADHQEAERRRIAARDAEDERLEAERWARREGRP